MNKERCNILICGSNSSGSSAVFSLLSEYENINQIPNEFKDFSSPCLVEDQLRECRSKYYPNKIDEFTRIGNLKWRIIYNIIPRIIWEKEFNHKIFRYFKSKTSIRLLNNKFFLKKLNKSLTSESSLQKKLLLSRNWIQQIGNINGSNTEYALFDQPLSSWNDIKIWSKVFKPFKIICVYRNPKDQIAEKLRNNGLFVAPFNTPNLTGATDNIMTIYGRERIGIINFNLDAIKKRLEYFDYLENNLSNDDFLLIDFEGFANNYDVYKSVIESFVGDLKYNHKFPKKYFDPEIAKESIDIHKNYLNDEDLMQLTELEDWYNKKIRDNNIEIIAGNLKCGIYND